MLHRAEFSYSQPDDGPCLRIHVLGSARVEWGGRPLPIQRRQARALLYRVASQMDPVPREELCFAFWPDEPDLAAHRHLSHLLSHLRACLPMPDVIVGSNDLVEVNTDRAWCDAAEFRMVCSLPDTRQPLLLQHTVNLYHGPFLSGFSLADGPEFEAWVVQERSNLERLYLDALAALVRNAANQADWTRAITYAREYLKVDELAEEVHRRLMVLHIMVGNRAAALQQYQECTAILKREFGVPPLPATRAIYESILQNEI